MKYLRCDNIGENLKTNQECLEECFSVTFEFIAVNTPQQNGRVERRYATLYGRVRGVLNAANLNKTFRCGLWAECARTATILDNFDCKNKSGKTRHYLFNGEDYNGFDYLRVFGEVGIATQGQKSEVSWTTGVKLVCIWVMQEIMGFTFIDYWSYQPRG